MDEWPESISSLYEAGGEAGLQRLPGVGKSLAAQLTLWLQGDLEDQGAGIQRSV